MTASLTRIEKRITPLRSTFVASALLIAAGAGIALRGLAAEDGHMIPAPAVDEQAAAGAPATSEVAVLAGGCFWGVQGSRAWLT
jgi:peptide-methionine (S)-S-oxide reductase